MKFVPLGACLRPAGTRIFGIKRKVREAQKRTNSCGCLLQHKPRADTSFRDRTGDVGVGGVAMNCRCLLAPVMPQKGSMPFFKSRYAPAGRFV